MPNIKSAKKRVKVIATKTMANKAVKSDLKTAIKKAIQSGQEVSGASLVENRNLQIK